MSNNYQMPIVLGSLAAGNQPLADFDEDFDAVARMGTLMCAATGANGINLSPLVNYPTLVGLGDNQKVGFIASANSTGAVTLDANSTGAFNAYANDGVTPIGNGDLIEGRYYEFLYNTTLNSSAGGWQYIVPNVNPSSAIALNSITGFLPSSITGANTTASLTVALGQAAGISGVEYLAIANPTNWSVTNGNNINGYQGGTTLPDSETIHFYVVKGTSGIGVFASTAYPLVSPPTGYTSDNRRIFSLITNSSGALLNAAIFEIFGGGYRAYYTAEIQDVSSGSVASTGTLFSVSVPSDLRMKHIGRYNNVSASVFLLFSSPDEPITAATSVYFDSYNGSNGNFIMTPDITTNLAAQITATSSATTAGILNIFTRGYDDFRRE